MAEYIDKEKLIYAIKSVVNGEFIRDFKTVALRIISEQPPADVAEVRHGKWDRNHNCSVCGVYKFKGLDADVWADWNIDYCPNCGAKMDLEV